MCDLPSHGKKKKNNPVAKQYGPKDRNIKYRKEGHHKCYAECLCEGIPGNVTAKTSFSCIIIRRDSKSSPCELRNA
uniref:Protein RER1A-like n=1 Tax=Rhizophora mucronata TaxID=61149 RepID=A0A2P2MG92_RHIMU